MFEVEVKVGGKWMKYAVKKNHRRESIYQGTKEEVEERAQHLDNLGIDYNVIKVQHG